MSNSQFNTSKTLLERAEQVIPLGTQTFSKSQIQFPKGACPHFINKAQGSHVWDVDGNEYIDFVSGLLSILLGYQDSDINNAVQAQLKKGATFSLPNPIEIDVAESIVETVPCAEMVRFGKNGSDATTAAIRIARAYTKRDKVAVCGYHGWHDWYIGTTTRDLGVPESTKKLTLKFSYNDINSLNEIFARHKNKIAAVIMEPMNLVFPESGFLEEVKEVSQKNGALLIFDEIITGFRFHIGGAQALFNVTPDLATFGKGLANGFPLSVITGRADVMKVFEDAFVSFTMGSEALSLAAANAVISKLKTEPVLTHIHTIGSKLIDGVNVLLDKYDAKKYIDIQGHPSWSFIKFNSVNGYSDSEIKTLWMQELIKRGILSIGTHNINYAHSDNDIKRLLDVYDEVIPILVSSIANKNLLEKLNCEPLSPVFKIR